MGRPVAWPSHPPPMSNHESPHSCVRFAQKSLRLGSVVEKLMSSSLDCTVLPICLRLEAGHATHVIQLACGGSRASNRPDPCDACKFMVDPTLRVGRSDCQVH